MIERRGAASAGFAALRHGKLILLLTLTTVVLGAAAAAPLLPTLRDTMVDTLAGDHFARNSPLLAPADFLDFFHEKEAAIDGVRRSMNAMAMLGVVLQVFFAGGIIAVLGRGRFSFGQFFEPARRNFWHNVKCFFLFAISAGIALGAWLGGAGFARKKLLENAAPDAGIRPLTFWILALVAVFLFAALSLLYDLARAARRFSPAMGAWRSFGFARRALSGSWGRALGLWLLWFLLGGAAVLGLFAATWEMHAVSRPAIALLMILQLLVLWVRSAARVAAWGSYVEFLEPRAAAALPSVPRF